MNDKIYCMNCESAFHIESLLNYLNTHKDSLSLFEQAENFHSADYALFVIGEDPIDNLAVAESRTIIESPLNTIILVKKNLFEQYESQRKSVQNQKNFSSNAFQLIRLFNENRLKRKWIYTYAEISEIIPVVGNIILSEYFEAAFANPIIKARPGEHFQNNLLLQNNGHIKLRGYYIDSFYGLRGGKYRPRLKKCLPVIGEILPQERIFIPLDFQAPDFAGAFISYIIIKKEGLLLKMEDSIRSFVLHVREEASPSACDAVLLEEYPENGKLYTEKTDFEKVWRLKNISNENWRKIICKVKYESVTHYFCKERKKVITDIPNGSEFTVRVKFHPPDIPGKYIALFQLFRENRTEIITDAPLSCSVITQYETLSEFEVCERMA